jgi:hypothetical protein
MDSGQIGHSVRARGPHPCTRLVASVRSLRESPSVQSPRLRQDVSISGCPCDPTSGWGGSHAPVPIRPTSMRRPNGPFANWYRSRHRQHSKQSSSSRTCWRASQRGQRTVCRPCGAFHSRGRAAAAANPTPRGPRNKREITANCMLRPFGADSAAPIADRPQTTMSAAATRTRSGTSICICSFTTMPSLQHGRINRQ